MQALFLTVHLEERNNKTVKFEGGARCYSRPKARDEDSSYYGVDVKCSVPYRSEEDHSENVT